MWVSFDEFKNTLDEDEFETLLSKNFPSMTKDNVQQLSDMLYKTLYQNLEEIPFSEYLRIFRNSINDGLFKLDIPVKASNVYDVLYVPVVILATHYLENRKDV